MLLLHSVLCPRCLKPMKVRGNKYVCPYYGYEVEIKTTFSYVWQFRGD